MATLSSPGLGSGLDVNTIISQLMQIERRPLTALDTKESGVKAKISAFGSISSLLGSVKDAAKTLADPTKLAGYKANFADTAIASGSATSSAAAGTYAINVKQLASAHKVASNTAFTGSTQVVGQGSFDLTVGSTTTTITLSSATATLGDLRDAINNADAGVKANLVTADSGTKLVLTAEETGQAISTANVQDLNLGDGADFATLLSGFTTVGGPHKVATGTAFSGSLEQVGKGTLDITVGSTTTSVAIAGANATLDDVKTAINAAGAGVTASIVTDTSGTRLQLTASDSSQLISVTAVDDDATDGIDFTKLRGYNTVGSEPQIARQAIVEIDGQTVTSDSNTLESAIGGVTLNLGKTGSTSLTVARDTSGVTTAVDAFVSAYNTLNQKIRTLTAYDSTNQKASTLTGDATARSIQNQLSSALFGSGGNINVIDTLSDLGVSFSTNGDIKVDSGTLADAIDSDLDAVISTLGSYGDAFETLAEDMTETDGLIYGRTEGLNLSIKDIDRQRETLELRLEAIEKRYRAQYTALDQIVASMQQTSSYLSQQLAALS